VAASGPDILDRSVPIYEYRCKKGHTFEVMQSMSDDPVTACTECGSPVERVFHPVAVHFKGSGFYSTDYGRGRSGGGGDSAGGDSKDAGSGKSDSSTSSDSSSGSDSGSKSESSKSDSSSKSSGSGDSGSKSESTTKSS
jgi:putative FmdB family regulatory protein